MENLAQFGHAVVFGAYCGFECRKHQAVTCLVEEQLHSKACRSLQYGECLAVGNDGYHAVVVDVAHGGAELEETWIVGRVKREEAYRFAVLEAVLYFLVFCAEHLNHQLVERVVVTAADVERIPAYPALYLASYRHGGGFATEVFALVFVFFFQLCKMLGEI